MGVEPSRDWESEEEAELGPCRESVERACMDPDGPRSEMGGQDNRWNYAAAKKSGLTAHKETFPSSGCSEACLEAQLDAYHRKVGMTDETPLRAYRSNLTAEQEKFAADVLKKTPRRPDDTF